MQKLPYDIGILHKWSNTDNHSFQLRFNDLNIERQTHFIKMIKEESTAKAKVRNLPTEILQECLNYINPLIIRNGNSVGMYESKAIKSGGIREIGQLVNILIKTKPMTEHEMQRFTYLVTTESRYREMGETGEKTMVFSIIRETIRRRGVQMLVPNDDSYLYNFSF